MTGQRRERLCAVEDCNRRHLSRGWCGVHYRRWSRTGDPLSKRPRELRDPMARFLRYVLPQEDGCWLWSGYLDADGYGKFTSETGQPVGAHRYSHQHWNGPLSSGLQIDHLCRNSRCVNPDHLEEVTPQENNRRSRSWSGSNLRKTVCPRGHPYDVENTYWHRGKRSCKECRREHVRSYRARSVAA